MQVNIQILPDSHRFLCSKDSIIFFLKQENLISQYLTKSGAFASHNLASSQNVSRHICVALRDLVALVQFKKREKHP